MSKNVKKAKPTGWLYKIGRVVLWPYYKLVYRIHITGRDKIPAEGPVLLCSNHMAMKDPVVLGLSSKRQVFYMAKEELFRNKFFSGLIRTLGAFPVKRGSGGTDALEEAYHILGENGVVGIFIEGHRSKTGQLQKPKTGAAMIAYRTGAKVVPVCITAEDGRICKAFHKTLVRFGEPMELSIPDDSSMQLRRASRTIMEEITRLRKETLEELGIPEPDYTQETAKKEESGSEG